MKREIAVYLVLFLAVSLFGGFAWLTRNPDSPWLEKAQEWPLVGDLARRFREVYLGPEASGGGTEGADSREEPASRELTAPRRPAARPPARAGRGQRPESREAAEDPIRPTEPLDLTSLPTLPTGGEPSFADAVVAPGGSVVRSPSDRTAYEVSPRTETRPPLRYVASEWTWFMPGQRIRASTEPDAAVDARLDTMTYLPVLVKDGNWAEVVYRDRRGWIDTSLKPSHARRGAQRGLLRHRAEPVRPSDFSRLKRARKILGIERPSIKLGAYTLYSDVQDENLLEFLDRAARGAEEAYFARYGRLPSGDPKRSIVLFATEAKYREYSKSARVPGGSAWHAGHAGSGVLAFFAEGRSRESLARTLVHEITHLLNDRSLAWRLPPWLEEGLASDLGAVWVEDSPAVASDGLSDERSLVIQGPETRFLSLGEFLEAQQLPSVTVLLSLDSEKFYEPGVQGYAYAHSFAFVRYLLDGDDGRHSQAFLTFLKRIAGGLEADLLKLLDMSVEELDQGFREWLRAEVEKSRDSLAERFSRRARTGL